jgi:hypothetical protein
MKKSLIIFCFLILTLSFMPASVKAAVGAVCANDAACAANEFCKDEAPRTCLSDKTNNYTCARNEMCASGLCDLTPGKLVCKAKIGDACTVALKLECITNFCDAATNKCTEETTASCTDDEDCASGVCDNGKCLAFSTPCTTQPDCNPWGYCNMMRRLCYTKLAENQVCGEATQCQSGNCDSSRKICLAPGSVPAGTAAVSPAGPGGGASAALAVPSITIPDFLGITDPNDLIARIIKVIIGLSGTLALIMFIYGGITFMISGGQPKQIKAGTNAMMYSAGGLILIFASYIIVNQLLSILIRK